MHDDGRARRAAFTLIELLVVVAIIMVLFSVLLPALSGARAAARVAVCGSNLRQLGAGIHVYAHEWEGQVPHGPESLHPFDFRGNQIATNQLWIGAGRAVPPRQARRHTGLGDLMATTCPQPQVYFCPADDNFNQAHELPKIGSEQDAYGSYLYRQLDHLPESPRPGLLDRLGANQIGDVAVPVEALALDTNSLGPGPYYHTNHGARWANVLFRDGSVRGFANTEDCLALPAAAFANPAGVPLAIDQLLTNADHAYRTGAPHRAPRIVSSP